jgi:hypothetical protein
VRFIALEVWAFWVDHEEQDESFQEKIERRKQ